MNKEEFIKWIENQSGHWGSKRFQKIFSESNDYWDITQPGKDCILDDINLETEGKVI